MASVARVVNLKVISDSIWRVPLYEQVALVRHI